MIFPLMPLSTPGELDPKKNLTLMEFSSGAAYFQWQLKHTREGNPSHRMATYAECGEVIATLLTGIREIDNHIEALKAQGVL